MLFVTVTVFGCNNSNCLTFTLSAPKPISVPPKLEIMKRLNEIVLLWRMCKPQACRQGYIWRTQSFLQPCTITIWNPLPILFFSYYCWCLDCLLKALKFFYFMVLQQKKTWNRISWFSSFYCRSAERHTPVSTLDLSVTSTQESSSCSRSLKSAWQK
jgi:hypothetical protein